MSNESISEELNSGLVAGVATHDGKECEGIPDSENKKKNKRKKKKKKKKVETSDIDPHGCDDEAENTGPLPKSFENDQGEDGNELHSSNKGTPIEEGEEVVPAPREASGGKKRKKKKKKKTKESETSMDYEEDPNANNSLKQQTEDGSGVAKDDKREEQEDEDNSQSLAEDNASPSERIESKEKKVGTSDNDPHGCDAEAENTGPLPKSFENDNGEDGNKLHSSDKGTPIEEGEKVIPAPREASGGKKRKKKNKKKSKESETSMVYVEDLKPNNSLKQHTEKQDDTSPMDGSGVAKDDKRHFVETKRNEQGDEDNYSQSLAEDNASLSERKESKDQDDDTASSIDEKTTSVPVPHKECEICTPKDEDEKGEAESERTMKPSSRVSEELHVDGLAPLRDPSSVAVQTDIGGGEGEEEIEDRREKEEEEEKVESDSHGDPSNIPSGNEE